MQMKRVSHTKEELLGYLQEQIGFLISSTNSYDSGFEGEAKRLAVVIRVLVHDTSKSTSLLTWLHAKDIGFYDSGVDYEPEHSISHSGLAIMEFSPSGARYCAPLDDLPPESSKDKKVSFDEWWNKVVYADDEQNILTRKHLVLNVANKEGGAHIDPKLDEAYANLSRFNSPAWKFIRNGVPEDFKNSPVLANIRQIAHEVLKILKDEFPDLF